jgi:hypothetical protein
LFVGGVLALTACGGARSSTGLGGDAVVLASLPPQPLDRVLLLEQSGASPADTVVSFPASHGRTIVMRHAPPDNAIFALIAIPADSTASDTIRVELTPLPGRYAVRVAASPRLPSGAKLTFSYAIHFRAPEGATARYGTVSRYARALGVGRFLDDEQFGFLAESRPATDMLRIELGEPGDFAVAAPR